MKFRYIGEKENLNGVFGYDFSGHKVVEVTEPRAISKLSNNRFFEIVIPEPIQEPVKIIKKSRKKRNVKNNK